MLKEGGGLEHMRVIYVAPGEVLRMSGALGPLQGSGVAGSLTWSLAATTAGTTVELSYSVVLEEQLRRFKLFVETGKPASEAVSA
jgi:hypothetical protein